MRQQSGECAVCLWRHGAGEGTQRKPLKVSERETTGANKQEDTSGQGERFLCVLLRHVALYSEP